ncbi:MAG: DNA polymerase III subunit delta [Deinococcales bacterium]
MAVALVGNGFLIAEAARLYLQKHGLSLKDVPWLDQDLTAQSVSPHLQGGLFGAASALIDLSNSKEQKQIAEEVAKLPDAIVALLDAENWTSSEAAGEVMRKKKAQEGRIKHYEKLGLELQRFPTPTKGALIAWVAERAKKMKLPLEREAIKLLADTFPDDLASIASELNKLALLEVKLDEKTVAEVVNAVQPSTIFAVTDALVAKKPKEAWVHLERLLNTGEDPFRLLGALQGHYALLARAFALQQRDAVVNAKEAAKTLAVHEFRAQKALEATRRYSEKTVRLEQKLLLGADVGMKSGLEPRLTLERLILELCVI